MTDKVVAVRTKWYGSIRIFRDGSIRFSPWAYKRANHVTIRGGLSALSVFISGRQVMLLYPWPRKLVSACFVYTLAANELIYAVDTLSKVTGGLESWIIPALEWTQKDLAGSRSVQSNYPDVVAVIPHLLEAYRDLPVSMVWQRRRRETQDWWVKRLRTHPEKISEVTAPWMLPDGYRPSPLVGDD